MSSSQLKTASLVTISTADARRTVLESSIMKDGAPELGDTEDIRMPLREDSPIWRTPPWVSSTLKVLLKVKSSKLVLLVELQSF